MNFVTIHFPTWFFGAVLIMTLISCVLDIGRAVFDSRSLKKLKHRVTEAERMVNGICTEAYEYLTVQSIGGLDVDGKALLHKLGRIVDPEYPKCEGGCPGPVVMTDSEGAPLCQECVEMLGGDPVKEEPTRG